MCVQGVRVCTRFVCTPACIMRACARTCAQRGPLAERDGQAVQAHVVVVVHLDYVIRLEALLRQPPQRQRLV